MEIKTTIRHHLTTVNMVIIKKPTNNKYWRECGERENCHALLLQMLIAAGTLESSMELPQEITNGTTYGPLITLVGIYQKKQKTVIGNNIFRVWKTDADPSPWQDLCYVAAVEKFTQTTDSCAGKQKAWPLSQEESTPTLALIGFY